MQQDTKEQIKAEVKSRHTNIKTCALFAQLESKVEEQGRVLRRDLKTNREKQLLQKA